MATKHFENGIVSSSAGGSSDIATDIFVTGDVWWVDSVNGNDANDGRNRNAPLATLEQAHTNAAGGNGDLIILEAGHTETLGASLTISKDGLRILGLGTGSSKPSFTCNAAIDMFNITGEHVEINNLLFPVGTTAQNTARINVANDGVRIENCDFYCGQYDLETITLATLVDDCVIKGCTFTVSADGPDSAIEIEAADVLGLLVESCTFDGGSSNWDNAAIYSTVAHDEWIYRSNTLTNKAHIIHTASAKGQCVGVIAGDGSRVEV